MDLAAAFIDLTDLDFENGEIEMEYTAVKKLKKNPSDPNKLLMKIAHKLALVEPTIQTFRRDYFKKHDCVNTKIRRTHVDGLIKYDTKCTVEKRKLNDDIKYKYSYEKRLHRLPAYIIYKKTLTLTFVTTSVPNVGECRIGICHDESTNSYDLRIEIETGSLKNEKEAVVYMINTLDLLSHLTC